MATSEISSGVIDAALAALDGKTIDGRKFWTDEDRSLMSQAINAAFEASAKEHFRKLDLVK